MLDKVSDPDTSENVAALLPMSKNNEGQVGRQEHLIQCHVASWPSYFHGIKPSYFPWK